ncbi:unnamed protein product [Bursaphelenchus okinawaensis]|uniref:Uncharacterized protein n=1 Tax=Bursaphelenchus okinawaensis TaxID=465554 RepID=A0A811KZC3_9BILA|nr:unnamed protein product [Bursaphelenchus okinawaensis]CAG9114159.1 unnamed protein product [Bursaphelenchus okinawaensis]
MVSSYRQKPVFPRSPQYFDLDVNKFQQYEYHTAIRLMLKLKAKKLLTQVDETTSTLYQICSKDAKLLPELARCIVKVMDSRDQSYEVGYQNEDNPIVLFINSLRRDFVEKNEHWRVFRRKRSSAEKQSKPDQIQGSSSIPGNTTISNSTSSISSTSIPVSYIKDKEGNVMKATRYKTNNYYNVRTIEKKEDKTQIQKPDDVYEKRVMKKPAKIKSQMPETFLKLEKVKSYLKKAEYCRKFMNNLSRMASDYFQSLNHTTIFENRPPPVFSAFEQFVNLFENSQAFKRLSILSPRLFGLFPKEKNNGPEFLSPELLSFHDDGFFTIPSIIQNFAITQSEVYEWTDFLMKLTGAAQQIDDILTSNKDEIDFIENVAYPKIKSYEDTVAKYSNFKNSFSKFQQNQLQKHGYTFTTSTQSKFLYGETSGTVKDYEDSTQKEEKLEKKIRELAKMDKNSVLEAEKGAYFTMFTQDSNNVRVKRQESPDTEHHGPQVVLLEPWVFEHREGAVVLEGIILSPHAFAGDLMSPELLTMHLLSPSAFFSSVLSPLALFTRILSPSAFRSEILSPEFLSAYILNPETLLAEILSPKILDVRVASPRLLSLEILNPTILSPRVGSPESAGIRVLSPSILSPHIMSDGHLNIEILSPHLLSGHNEAGHDKEENHHFSPEHHHEHMDNIYEHFLPPHLQTMHNN